MLSWFWRSCSYPESIAKSPVPRYCTKHKSTPEGYWATALPRGRLHSIIYCWNLGHFSCTHSFIFMFADFKNVKHKPSQPQNPLTVSLKWLIFQIKGGSVPWIFHCSIHIWSLHPTRCTWLDFCPTLFERGILCCSVSLQWICSNARHWADIILEPQYYR